MFSVVRYLSGKITEGEAHSITCPAYECDRLVPVEVIEALVSRDLARRYLQFDIQVTCSQAFTIFQQDSVLLVLVQVGCAYSFSAVKNFLG